MSASHLDSFHAVRYRGISGLRLDKLTRVNLITGANGVGKTSLAEAIWLFANRFERGILSDPRVQRAERPVPNSLAALGGRVVLEGVEAGEAHRFEAAFETAVEDAPAPAHMVSEPEPAALGAHGQLRVWIDGTEASAAPGRPSSRIQLPLAPTVVDRETIDCLARIQESPKHELGRILAHYVLPLAKDVRVVDSKVLVKTPQDEWRSLPELGGTHVRVVRLFATLYGARNGIAIVDEFETGLHPDLLSEMWHPIKAMVEEFNVQLFATTHSYRCIRAAAGAFSLPSDRLSIHTMYSNAKWKAQATSYEGEDLDTALEMNLEVR